MRVFNSGDGPRPVQTTTDADGRFRLKDLDVGPVYVFARKAGYRFGGPRAATGSDVTLALQSSDEPPPAREVGRVVSAAERERLARRLLDALWALPPKRRKDVAHAAISNMARIDPEKALAWSGEVGNRWARLGHIGLAQRAAATEANEALSHLAPLGDDDRTRRCASMKATWRWR